MNLPSRILAVALVAAAPICLARAASAAPHGGWGGGLAWSGGHGWGGGHGGGGGHGWGWGGPAAGLAAGAIIGGAVAASRYGYNYDYAPGYYGYGYNDYGYAPGGYVETAPGGDSVAYCAQRFRSYDPASGTYLGFDEYRHPCP